MHRFMLSNFCVTVNISRYLEILGTAFCADINYQGHIMQQSCQRGETPESIFIIFLCTALH